MHIKSSNMMKLLSLIPKLTKHVIQIRNEDRSDTNCWKNNMFVSHKEHTQRKI